MALSAKNVGQMALSAQDQPERSVASTEKLIANKISPNGA